MAEKESANPFMPQVEVVDPSDSVSVSIGDGESTRHPLASFFYVAFKVLAVMIYLVGRLFVSTSSQFVAVFLLSAVDFYTTKNFSGRYLIGVRWWSVDGGDNVLNSMRFEVSNKPERYTKVDSRFFWIILYIMPIAWLFLSLMCILKFNFFWLLVAGFALGTSGVNLYCYIKASGGSKNSVQYVNLPKQLAKDALSKVGSAALSYATSMTRR